MASLLIVVTAAHEYSDDPRADMVPFIPRSARAVLDVGCWAGGFGLGLKRANPEIEVWGVEPNPDAAAVAATRLDNVVCGTFPLDLPKGHFDCVVFNDALEHMPDPWSALEAAKELLGRGGVVVASIPNVRHYTVSLRLLLRGKWHYEDAGILDRTHLRFFTRSSMAELFSAAGFRTTKIEAGEISRPGGRFQVLRLARFLGDTGMQFLAKKFVIVAAPDASGLSAPGSSRD